MKITCDPAAAAAAMDTIGQRYEALMGLLWGAIRHGIDAHSNTSKATDLHVRPAEFENAFAALIVDLNGSDRLDHFHELVRLAAEPDFYETL